MGDIVGVEWWCDGMGVLILDIDIDLVLVLAVAAAVVVAGDVAGDQA